jgi:SAM-dependent methyltransferase
MSLSPAAHRRRAERAEDAQMRFEARYERRAQWDIGRPQRGVVELLDLGLIKGDVLDLGCGTGDNGLYFASKGFDVWGVDIVPGAIYRCRDLARKMGLPAARFFVGDGLALETLSMRFDTVIDSGFFHALDDEERGFYLPSIEAALRPGGLLHLLSVGERQAGGSGPRPIGRDEFAEVFGAGWTLLRVDEATFETNLHRDGLRAWRASLRWEGEKRVRA